MITYDVTGHRTSVGGSLASVTIPGAVSGNTYDADDRLTKFNGTTFAFDPDGNTLNDGVNTYTWDPRNQLSTVAGTAPASFFYDGFGRRWKKTVGPTTTQYLYDGGQFVEEQNSAGAATALELTGSVDELLARTTNASNTVTLPDALGSIAAETNVAMAVTAAFAYDPYGNTSETGTNSGNSQQFTGRENDGTGLYYNRARYYSPRTARFISRDPIGFAGGGNVYAYVDADPVALTDYTGLCPDDCWNSWNNSGAGKVINFFSLASPFIGPDPLVAAALDGTLMAGKYGLYSALPGVATRGFYGWAAGIAAEYVVKEIALPLSLGSTAVQVGVYLECKLN
jgi:RHS repeat-associated protein